LNKQAFDADIVVVGGGMVGGMLAAALARPDASGLNAPAEPLRI